MPHVAGEDILNSFQLETVGARLITRDYIQRRPSWVGGQISSLDSVFLSGLVQALRPTNCVEIGVASGWSSSVLLTSLHHAKGQDFTLHALDLSEQYYLDKTISTGSAVDLMEPELKHKYNLMTGVYAIEGMKAIGDVDFAFIDAHHMHPWTTLDLIAILPFIGKGSWVAMHDINLCRFVRHQHKNRGPFYTYYMWPDGKLNSTQNPSMIGAIHLRERPLDYMPILIEVLSTPWELAIDGDVLRRMCDFVQTYFDADVTSEFKKVVQRGNASFLKE